MLFVSILVTTCKTTIVFLVSYYFSESGEFQWLDIPYPTTKYEFRFWIEGAKNSVFWKIFFGVIKKGKIDYFNVSTQLLNCMYLECRFGAPLRNFSADNTIYSVPGDWNKIIHALAVSMLFNMLLCYIHGFRYIFEKSN